MACCKCQEHGWEDPQEPVHTDDSGMEYCLFHAPAEHKGMTVEAFNEQVFARIRAVGSGLSSLCNLAGTIFPGPVCFSHFTTDAPLPAISFMACEFDGKAIFTSAAFGDLTLFDGAAFNHKAFFTLATFGEASFTGTTFSDWASFNATTFGASASFDEAAFNGWACFNSATFKKTSFHSTTFSGGALFKATRFHTRASFDSATFDDVASFISTLFLKNKVSFRDVTFNRAQFSDIVTKGELDFGAIRTVIHELRFADMDLDRCEFLGTDMTNVHFVRCGWPVADGRYCIAAEGESGLEEVRDFYQGMKRKYKQEHNEAEVSKWHVAEKEMELRIMAEVKGPSFTRGMLQLYRLSSRFGEDAARAAWVLALLIGFTGFLLGLGGIADSDTVIRGIPWPWAWNWGAIGNFGLVLKTLFMNVLLFRPESIPFKPVFGLVDGIMLFFTRLVIPIQAALFAFALRNRFRR